MALMQALLLTDHLQAADRSYADLRRRLRAQLLACAVAYQPLLLFGVELHTHLLAAHGPPPRRGYDCRPIPSPDDPPAEPRHTPPGGRTHAANSIRGLRPLPGSAGRCTPGRETRPTGSVLVPGGNAPAARHRPHPAGFAVRLHCHRCGAPPNASLSLANARRPRSAEGNTGRSRSCRCPSRSATAPRPEADRSTNPTACRCPHAAGRAIPSG